jgi:hypothetical protein
MYTKTPNEQFDEGRICKICSAKLSIYNSSDTCFCHSWCDRPTQREAVTKCSSRPNKGMWIVRMDYYGETGPWTQF